MSLTPAETVRKKTINSPQIVSLVNDIIEAIDGGILAASVQTNEYNHVMPTDLFIPGIKKSNAQRIVYYHVAKRLQKAGYTLQITMKKVVIFHISWVTDMMDSDVKKIDKYLVQLKRNPVENVSNPVQVKKPTTTPNAPKKVDLELDDFYRDV